MNLNMNPIMYFAKDFEGFLIHINCAFDSCNHVPDKRLTMKLYAMVHLQL